MVSLSDIAAANGFYRFQWGSVCLVFLMAFSQIDKDLVII